MTLKAATAEAWRTHLDKEEARDAALHEAGATWMRERAAGVIELEPECDCCPRRGLASAVRALSVKP
jgi:hypothetical protein